jgi:tellurite resistance protein TehA-like permease
MRPAIFILLALALSGPTLVNIISGADSAVAAGEHLGAAILVSWVAVRLVGYLVDMYRATITRRQQEGQEHELRAQH